MSQLPRRKNDWKIKPDPPRRKSRDEAWDHYFKLVELGVPGSVSHGALQEVKSCGHISIEDDDED